MCLRHTTPVSLGIPALAVSETSLSTGIVTSLGTSSATPIQRALYQPHTRAHTYIIGASLSEPHINELCGSGCYVCMYIYVCLTGVRPWSPKLMPGTKMVEY